MSQREQILEIYGSREPRRYMVLKFVERYLSGIINRASTEAREGVEWEQVWPDDVETDQLYIRLISARAVAGTSYVVENPGDYGKNLGRVERPSDTAAVEVSELPRGPLVRLRPDTSVANRQRNALRSWVSRPNADRDHFFRILHSARQTHWTLFGLRQVDDWAFLVDDSRPGVEQQREFVRKALSTPDFALLDGPPGSGKTTVICEIIAQVVRDGGRVLLCAQTHEAVDNALERLMSENTTTLGYVTPVRVGRDVDRASPFAQQFFRQNLEKTVCDRLAERLLGMSSRTASQDRILDAIRGDRSEIGRMIVQSANVVCGTTSGAVGDPILAPMFQNAIPEFDMLIVDEASKLTLQEFLVPSLIARRWVLSGDPMQLPPFSDQDEIERHLRSVVGEMEIDVTAEPQTDELGEPNSTQDDATVRNRLDASKSEPMANLVSRMLDAFQLRFLPEEARATEDHAFDEAFDQFAPEVASQLRRETKLITGLKLRSVLESLIVPRGIEESLNDPNYAAAIDLGIPQSASRNRTTLLEIQQRMHPDISVLVRESVYQGRALRDADGMKSARSWSYDEYAGHAVWKRVTRESISSVDLTKFKGLGKFATSFSRDRLQLMAAEGLMAAEELDKFITWADLPENAANSFSVAIICFNKPGPSASNAALKMRYPQLRVRSSHLGKRNNVRLRVDTVDSFQGREADLVFVNLNHWRSTSHLRSLNRINVALTRARYQLVVVGRADAFRSEPDGLLIAELSRRLPYAETL